MFSRLRAKCPGQTVPQLLLYEAVATTVNILTVLLYAKRAYGLRNIPATGPCLLVANHQSYLDPPLIGSSIRHRHINFVARLGLFRSAPLRWLITALNSTPIREDGSGDVGAMKEILRRLEGGHAVLIFPEGTRSRDGTMSEFKRGVAVLVKRAKCPVVPIAVDGAFDAWPRSSRFPRIFGARAAIMVGKPIDSETLMIDGPDAAMKKLGETIESMRMQLRRSIRRSTAGLWPSHGPADEPSRVYGREIDSPPANSPRPTLRIRQTG